MAVLKKILLIGLFMSLILEQVYVFHYYFNVRNTDELECSDINSVTILGSLLQILSSAYSTSVTPIDPENKYLNNRAYKIFFIIMSYPDNLIMRSTLRNTWVSELANHTELEYAFVIGLNSLSEEEISDLRIEEEAYHDIIFLEDHTDVELEITVKVLKSYVWAYENVKSEFLVKLRDDSYVAVDNLLGWFKDEDVPKIEMVMGSFLWKQPVEKKDGRWSEPEWFICPDTYLPFPRGEGYVTSWDIVEFLHNHAEDFRIYRHDDITLGLWLSGLKLARIESKKVMPDFEPSACSNDWLIIGNMKSIHMKNMHRLWRTNKVLCEG